ncbi:unnamed protein product, partial [Rhizoctonia solani]
PVPSEYDPTGTPLPATPLCNTPEPEEFDQDANPEEHHRFFANLLHVGNDGDFDLDFDFNFDFGDGQGEFGDGEEGMDVGEVGDEELDDGEGIDGDRREEQAGREERDRDGDNGDPPIQELDDDDEEPNEDELVAAFCEHPILRNIYLRAYVDLAFGHATKEQIRNTLLSHKLSLESAARVGVLPLELLEGLLKMPLSVRSLERRLGMDTTSSIRIYTLCEDCGTRYSPEQIKLAPHPRCTYGIGDNICGAILYTEEILYGGTRKRNPIRSYPYIPLHGSLEHLLLRPGMKELMQSWRGQDPDNRAEDTPPRDQEYWIDHGPETFGDISQAWGWWNTPVGLTRGEFLEEEGGGYGDSMPNDPVALASRSLGLSLALNLDGFQAFGHGKYSTTGVYITINNLPFYLRTIIENMLLVIAIPGPNEPTDYEFDQIMKPLIDDLVALGQGIRLNVHDKHRGRPDVELIHGHLSLAILDHMARLKVCGHAGTRSEQNFCLYCKKRRCYLSVPEGFKLRENELRDPLDRLDDKYRWLKIPTAKAQEHLRLQTGVTFTEFDRLPGWYGASNCPIDSMHLFDLGITKFLCQKVLLKPGLLHPLRHDQPFDEQPASKFDAFVARTQFPSFCQRKPPRFLNMTSNVKAEQWKHIAIILPAALFEAWRDGDLIPNTFIPHGGRTSRIYKFQKLHAAQLLRNRVLVHRDRGGMPRDDPKELSCVAIRNRRLIYATICRYLVARSGLVRHKITRDGITTSQRLLRQVGRDLTRMNYQVTPNLHTALHLEEGILQYGSLYGFHTAPFERANRVLININNNGHIGGAVETTMARGWLKRAGCHTLVREMQEIENPSPDDITTTKIMLSAMRDGPEHERQRGRLNAILAGEENFQSQAILRLATTSVEVDWHKFDHRPYWELVAEHCSHQLPGVIVYPYGLRPNGGVRLADKNSTRSLPHIHVNGIRYGTDFHHRAYNSRYAYIDPERHPVLIRRIYQAILPVQGGNREIISAVVQRFQPPVEQPGFPWDDWGDQLEIAAWRFQELNEPEVINVTRFSGTFALSDIQMQTGHHWLTFAMQPMEPEVFDNGE